MSDAFGREVRTFTCEHGTLIKIEGLGSEAMWPVRLLCPLGCDIEFDRPTCGEPAPYARFVVGEHEKQVDGLSCSRESEHPIRRGTAGVIVGNERDMHTAVSGSTYVRWTDQDDQGRREIRASMNASDLTREGVNGS